MTRNLKALGLAAVAALALSALAASAAQATTFHHLTVPSAPSIVTADDETGVVFTTSESEIKCSSLKYEATLSEKTSSEITATPTLSECTNEANGGAATVTTNHCAFMLNGETDVNGHAQGHLECAAGNKVEVSFKVAGSQCTLDIEPQTAKGGVHLVQTKNAGTEKQDITASVTISEIHYTITGPSFPCSLTGSGEDATMSGAVTVGAYTEKESCTALSGTEKTTPGSHFNNCENAVQDLELTTT